MEPGKAWKDYRSGRASGPSPGYGALPSRPRNAQEAQPADLSAHQAAHWVTGLFPSQPLVRTTAPMESAEGTGRPPHFRAPAPHPFAGTATRSGRPCPPSSLCLASPPSSLTIAPGSPARVFLLPVAPGQLRRRSRDVGTTSLRRGRGLLVQGRGLLVQGRRQVVLRGAAMGQNGRDPFPSPQKPSLERDRRQPQFDGGIKNSRK